MKKKIWDLPQPQQPITIWQLYGTTVGECRSMPGILIQNTFVLQDIPFPINRVIIDQLVLKPIDICFNNTL